ncbi:MAG: hypothetical protein ACREOO_11020 [bacterium]
MKSARFIMAWMFMSPLLLLAPLSHAQSKKQSPQSFHDALGEMVDYQENIRYNLFGQIEGFTAARLYAFFQQDYYLHLLRNREAQAQLIIVRLTAATHQQLRQRINLHIAEVAQGKPTPAGAAYSISETQWGESTGMKKVALRDGTTINGTLYRAQGDTLFVQTASGLQIPVPDPQIVELSALDGEIREGEFYRSDPNNSRLLLAPTGRGLQAGRGYFADYFLFFPTLAVGLTDNVALSGGVSIVPGASSQLAYFGPKLSFAVSPQVGLSTGLLYVVIPEDSKDVTLTYAVGTFGNNRNSVTLGTALPIITEEEVRPILLFGGEAQVSNGAKLITENWFFTGDETTLLFSGGVRFFGERMAVDLALVGSDELLQGEGFPFVPWVDFSVYFGK